MSRQARIPRGMILQNRCVLYLARMQFEFQALEARQNMKVQVKYSLTRRGPIQLGDHDARRLKCPFNGGGHGLNDLDRAAENYGSAPCRSSAGSLGMTRV